METGILPPKLKSIERLFTGNARFVVPQYQRSFAWTSDEIEELWEDLTFTMERKGDNFLGTIVLQKINADAGDHSFAEKQRLALNDSGLAINEWFHGRQKWGDKEIEQRRSEMAKVAVEIWNL